MKVRERSSICWFTLQIATIVNVGLGWKQELGGGLVQVSHVECRHQNTWNIFCHFSLGHCRRIGLEVERPGHKLLPTWDASITGGDFPCRATMSQFQPHEFNLGRNMLCKIHQTEKILNLIQSATNCMYSLEEGTEYSAFYFFCSCWKEKLPPQNMIVFLKLFFTTMDTYFFFNIYIPRSE